MIRSIQILVLLLTLISCGEESVDRQSEILDKKETKFLKFEDVIPDSLADSTKSERIIELVKKVEYDNTLIQKNFTDSSDTKITAFYRNDTLVKVITGLFSGTAFDTVPNISSHDHNTYYFFMDKFISLRYECNSFQNTGMCNPVSASSKFYFYDNHLIGQAHNNNIGQYGLCGCMDFSYLNNVKVSIHQQQIEKFELQVLSEAERLKKITNYR